MRQFARPFSTSTRHAHRKLPLPSREKDPFAPYGSLLSPAMLERTVKPADFTPSTEKPTRRTVPARGDMTVEKFLKTIGRGAEEHVSKFEEWDKLMLSTGVDMKALGIPVKQRKWILRWVEHYKQGREPYFLPLVSRAKKNKFLSKKKPKTIEQRKRD